MKLTLIIFFASITVALAKVHAQRISLNHHQIRLKTVLVEISRQSGYTFIYDEKELNQASPVTIRVKNKSVDETLAILFKEQPLQYQISGESIAITLKELPTLARTSAALRQEQTITGLVTDEEGQPLEGVTVIIQGTSIASKTDANGRYRINMPADDGTLMFSMLGYNTMEQPVGNRQTIDIVMNLSVSDLEEVVVVGYGTQKKSDLTGSVTRVDATTYENQSMTQLSEMLTGTVAGFNANQATSAEGGSSLEIRGQTSLSASTQPLIVLDGVIFNGSLADINPKDIEAIDILKDASSAAVFGSRAASGVIIITTKKGHTGKPSINFQSTIGITEVTNKDIRALTAKEYTDFRRDLLIQTNPNTVDYYFHNPDDLPSGISKEEWLNYNNNPNADITKEWLNRLLFFPAEVENYIAGTGVNWYDEVIQKGLRQNYDISLSGGSERAKYYWSLGYTDNEGIIVGDEFSTIRSRLNLDAEITDWLTVGVNTQFANRDESAVAANVEQMLISSPFGSMYNEDGTLKWFPNDYQGGQNPLINHKYQDRLSTTNSLFGVIYSELKLPFGINYRLSYQPRLSFTKDHNFWDSRTINGGRTHINGYGTREDSQMYEWMVDNLIKWNRKIGLHHFDVTLLYNIEKFRNWSSFQSGEDFSPNQNLSFHGLQFSANDVIRNDDNESTGDALMARLNYTLLDKYLLTASLRRDGYSAFGQKNPRATFPALAFAWKIDEEKFFSSNLINNLKLRLSWGINGNREIGRYAALARLSQNLYSNGSQVLVGVFNSSLANPSLVWEKTKAYNLGFDLGILHNRINATLDAYQMTTLDLLMQRNLPRITGFDDITTNLGELENRGIELGITTENINRESFQWRSNLVFSLNRNKIKRLFGDFEEVEIDGEIVRREISDISNQWFIGQPIDRVWDYEITGVWQESEAEEANLYGLLPGDYKAVDVNGDKVYSTLVDKQFIGWRQPRYRIGLRNDFTFLRNFSASIFIRADLGHIGSIAEFKHNNTELYDRRGMRAVPYWTAANPSNKYGSLTASAAPYSGGYNLYFPRSFVRIQDFTVSYKLPAKIIQKGNLTNTRIFGAVRNLYSFDQWEDWDPESGGSPMPRIYSFGLDVTF
ncbi:SusC/RagA family TonB-linked outer membrane protein [Parapedobacter indicus]|nr:SusC/RagA family TonB-linked outer membrane protein [Parapedobacter indicus]